jgi:hypothetical protein
MNSIRLKVLSLPSQSVKTLLTTDEHPCPVDIIGPLGAVRSGFMRPGGSASNLPFFKGNGSLQLNCGACGHTLARLIRPGQLRDVILVCRPCGAYNDTGRCGATSPHLN